MRTTASSKVSSWVAGPSSWNIATKLRNACFLRGLDIQIEKETTGWLFKRDNIRFTVTGPDAAIDEFIDVFNDWVERIKNRKKD